MKTEEETKTFIENLPNDADFFLIFVEGNRNPKVCVRTKDALFSHLMRLDKECSSSYDIDVCLCNWDD